MGDPIVFYSRCVPQGCDAVDIALANNITVFGYPLWREGVPYDPRNLDRCLVSPALDWEEWSGARDASRSPRREYAKNRNLVSDVSNGSIALIPRPKRGVVYAGYIKSPFQVSNSPPWYDDYLALRKQQGLSEDSSEEMHAGDVAQYWEVDKWRALPIPDVPAWIRGSLFGRSTYARIHAKADTLAPYRELREIMERETRRSKLEWTLDEGEIFLRLSRNMAPSNFEHLVVSLLQLERPNERWFQVGGSGDGGADGLGYTEDGDLAGVLQCKLVYHGHEPYVDALDKSVRKECRQYLASLHHPSDLQSTADIMVIGKPDVVRLVKQHWERLPEARAMRIGMP